MSPRLSAYYLPVTETVAREFVEHGTLPGQLIERVAVMVMLMASQSDKVLRANLSRALYDLYDQLLGKPEDVVAAQLQGFHEEVGHQDFDEVQALLLTQGIRFAPREKMVERAWCGADGRYAGHFQDLCCDTLTDYEIVIEPGADSEYPEEDDGYGYEDEELSERVRRRVQLRGPRDQERSARAITAASDEHFSMSAYAGTGKTHLLLALAEAGGRYTHLAPTVAHRQAFLQRVGPFRAIKSIALYHLANSMATDLVRKRSTRWINPPRVGETTWSLARQAELVGVPSIAGETPVSTLLTLFRIIRIWCYSEDAEIRVDHVRRALRIGALEDMAAYAEWAWKVWLEMSAALPSSQERPFSFNLFHLVKWLDVNKADIPRMGTLLVDEAHDLPAPWYSMLHRYPEGWVAMGDPYQCLSGRAPRAPYAKALVMAQSVRTGEQTIPLFQKVIDRHSESLVDDDIRGSRDHVTCPRPYRPTDELPHTGLRVYGSVWKMLEDALRIKNGGGQFCWVPASGTELIKAAQDAILLRRSGDRPRSYQLRPFKTWDMLADHLETQGYANVVRLFERGFDEANLDELSKSQSQAEQGVLHLGMLEHCKNMEFSTVTMSSCCFSMSLRALSRDERDKQVKAIYVAMTRVKDELWLPGDAVDRLAN